MNEYSESCQNEINLVELLFYCLRKWRWIVSSMIVIALAAGGYKYQSTVKSNQMQQQKQALLEENGEAVPVEVVKNPSVRYYEQAIASSEQELAKQEAYLRDSVVMQLDAYHLQVGTLSFYLDVADEQNENGLNNLLAAYQAYVTDGRLAKELFDMDDSIPIADLGYLLSFNKGRKAVGIPLNKESGTLFVETEQNIFQVQVVALNKEACIAYSEKIEAAITDYAVELKGEIAGHDLQLLAVAQSEKVDEEIAEYQDDVLSSYSKLLSDFKALKTDLETVRGKEGETITLGQVFVLENPVSASVKYGGIGLILGAFFASFVLSLGYLLSRKLQSTRRFQEEFGMQLLGEVKAPKYKKQLFGFIDDWLYRLEEGIYANIPREEQINIVVASLKGMIAQKEGLKKIMLTGTIAKEEVKEFYDCLRENIHEVTFSSYKQIVFDSMALEELDNYDALIFLEEKRVSYSKLIKKEQQLVSGRDIEVLGVVIV